MEKQPIPNPTIFLELVKWYDQCNKKITLSSTDFKRSKMKGFMFSTLKAIKICLESSLHSQKKNDYDHGLFNNNVYNVVDCNNLSQTTKNHFVCANISQKMVKK